MREGMRGRTGGGEDTYHNTPLSASENIQGHWRLFRRPQILLSSASSVGSRVCVAWIRNRGGDEEGKDRKKSEMCLSPALSLSFLSPVPQETLVLRLRDVSFLNGSIFCVVRVVLRRGVCPCCALACVLLGPGRKAGDRERVR